MSTLRGNKSRLTVDDVVSGSTKPPFGMGFYKTPSNESLMKKIHFGTVEKAKLTTFVEQIQKRKAWIPGPQYIKLYDWNQ